MRTSEFRFVFLGAMYFALAAVATAGDPIGTGFTYQGQLKQGGVPVTQTCDFEFTLWDDPVATLLRNQVGPALIFDGQLGNSRPVRVVNGLFTAALDFGPSAFNGDARWLQIGVCCSSPCSPRFTTLTPRQPLTATPYSLQTRGLFVDAEGHVGIGTRSPSSALEVNGNLEVTNLSDNDASNFFDGGCGDNAHVTGISTTGVISCAADSGDIAGVTPGTGLTGGGTAGTLIISHADTSSQASVNNAAGTVIQDITLDTLGHLTSLASTDLDGRYVNQDGGTMTGLLTLAANGLKVGTNQLVISSGNVGIGTANPLARLHVQGDGNDKLLLRGQLSAPFLHFRKNVNGSDWVLRHDDGRLHFQTEPPPTTGTEVLTIHASKRLGIANTAPAFPLQVGTDATNGNGAHVTTGGVWTNTSDRNSKKNFTPVDRKDILAKVANLPITEWQYKGEPYSVRHIGPVAQDFYVAFGLGHSDRHIGTIDAEGVALAAIQGLHKLVQEKDCQIEALHEGIAGISERLARLESLFPQPGIQETGGTP